jgi:myo-inositol-1-phosphate synthase
VQGTSTTTATPTRRDRAGPDARRTSAATTCATSSSRSAFDIDIEKVGKDLGQAIWSGQNDTIKFADVPENARRAGLRGMTHDGLGKYLSQRITKAPGETADIVSASCATPTPTSSSPTCRSAPSMATKWYVEQVHRSRLRLRQLHPRLHRPRGLLGSAFQEGAGCRSWATTSSRRSARRSCTATLARLMADRGVKIVHTSQLNVGGNMDFYNMLERERLESKKISKTNAVTSIMDHELLGERRPRRPVGLRPVADRPQVGAHPRRRARRLATCR